MRYVMSLYSNANGVVAPFVALSIDVLVPVDVSIEKRSRSDVNVPVEIEIHSRDTEDKVGIIIDESLGKVTIAIIAPQTDMVVAV